MARRVVIMQNGCLVTEQRIDDGLNDGKFCITLHIDNVELTSEVLVNLFGKIIMHWIICRQRNYLTVCIL